MFAYGAYHALYMTGHITNSGMGIHVCIFITAFYFMLISRTPDKFSIWLYLYLCVIFVLGTSQAIVNVFGLQSFHHLPWSLSGRDTSWLLIDNSDTVLVACVCVFILLCKVRQICEGNTPWWVPIQTCQNGKGGGHLCGRGCVVRRRVGWSLFEVAISALSSVIRVRLCK